VKSMDAAAGRASGDIIIDWLTVRGPGFYVPGSLTRLEGPSSMGSGKSNIIYLIYLIYSP
jgi:hypothetical protein